MILTEAQATNLITACNTSSMRKDAPAWQAELDALADIIRNDRASLAAMKPVVAEKFAKLTLEKHEEFKGFFWLTLETTENGLTNTCCVADMLRKRDVEQAERIASRMLAVAGYTVIA